MDISLPSRDGFLTKCTPCFEYTSQLISLPGIGSLTGPLDNSCLSFQVVYKTRALQTPFSLEKKECSLNSVQCPTTSPTYTLFSACTVNCNLGVPSILINSFNSTECTNTGSHKATHGYSTRDCASKLSSAISYACSSNRSNSLTSNVLIFSIGYRILCKCNNCTGMTWRLNLDGKISTSSLSWP